MWSRRRQALWVLEVVGGACATFAGVVFALGVARAAKWPGTEGFSVSSLAQSVGGFLICAGLVSLLLRTRDRRWKTK